MENNAIIYDLKSVISQINKIVLKIEKKSGFLFLNNTFIKQDNFKNQCDFEFKECDTYRVVKCDTCFEPYTKEPYNGYFEYIKSQEEAFCTKYNEELMQLFELLFKYELLVSFSDKKEKEKIKKF